MKDQVTVASLKRTFQRSCRPSRRTLSRELLPSGTDKGALSIVRAHQEIEEPPSNMDCQDEKLWDHCAADPRKFMLIEFSCGFKNLEYFFEVGSKFPGGWDGSNIDDAINRVAGMRRERIGHVCCC